MTDRNMRKHSKRAGSYGQVSGESPFEHVVYSAVTVVCKVKEALFGSMWLSNDLSQI